MDSEALGKILVEHGLLKADEVDALARRAAKAGETLEQMVRAQKLVYPEVLAQLKAKALDLPYIDLASAAIDPKAMDGISDQAARAYQFIAVRQEGASLRVAMASPEDWQSREAVRFIAAQRQLAIDVYCASPEAIERALHGAPEDTVRQALKEFGREFRQAKAYPPPGSKLQQALVKAPVTKIVAVIMRHAIDGAASDIHIEPSAKEVRVRYRIDGRLHTTLLLPAELQTGIALRIKSLAGLAVSESGLPQEGRFTVTGDDQSYSIRVSIVPSVSGERINLRLADATNPPPPLLDLGLSKKQKAALVARLRAIDGLIVVAGPSGAGKSTTMLSSLWEINTPATAIATIEDPVEFTIPGVSQTQLSPRTGLTYAKALAGLLRQDVDVIMVGELLDDRTGELAVRGAARGKRILTALSAADVASAISRLLNMGISPYMVAESLRLVLAQRLVPRLCPDCREEISVPADVKAHLQAELKKISAAHLRHLGVPAKPVLYDGRGCEACHDSKIQGQIGLFEVVPVFAELKSSIAAAAPEATLAAKIRTQGYFSLYQEGILKALQGIVRYTDVVRLFA